LAPLRTTLNQKIW